ncbi:hypothetical protein [Microvirga terrestris]|uniref:Glutamine amidotransferase type-2 domain-containing protein n=1 Tax=Microvirga terrestris TaxID=2791024 RepID=A0ABS0HPH6_9HYPH|nr:hypothetical protein [Microvirga terrestris]MBF9195383.1 hypothetical protein [Microvirga terrestris]
MSLRPYPRGFVLSHRAIHPPEQFVSGPLLDNFFIDPACSVDAASEGDHAVIVLGTCVDTGPETANATWLDRLLRRNRPNHESKTEQTPARHLLSALCQGEETFFVALDGYCGRHAILFRTKTGIRILTDATGMRTVFYAADGGVVASHARLVEEMLGGKPEKERLPFGYGFPGNRTPYSRTRLLTPNTLYDFAACKVERFWPRGPVKTRTASEAAHAVTVYGATALKNIALSHRIALSITAGLDSRTTLALTVHTGIPFEGYTYDRGPKTGIDCAVARELSKIAGFQHHVVKADKSSIPDSQALSTTTYYNHHFEVIAPMREHFAGTDTLTVTANLLEIGRFFYKGGKYDLIGSVETMDSMYELYLSALSPLARERVEEYGVERYKTVATEYFADFLETSRFNQARGILNPKDQFYWEHRMSAWHAMILLERDFYADCFIPFNSRRVFETLLGVPERERKSAKAFKLLIKACAPQLLEIPINPKEWPLAKSAS